MRRLFSSFFLLALFVPSVLLASVIDPAEGQQWYGYYTGSEQLSEFGTGQGETYSCAIYLSGVTGMASGKGISAIRFVIQGTDGMRNLKVWYSTSLPGTMDDVDGQVIDIDASDVNDREPYDVALAKPYDVTAKGVYVGYTFDADDPYPVLATTGVPTQAGGFFLKTSDTYPEWQNVTGFNYGNLAIQVLLDGEFHQAAAKVSDFGEAVAMVGSEVSVPVTVTNYGNDGMSSIDYIVSSDGVAGEEQHYDLPVPVTQVRGTTVVNVPFTAPLRATISHKAVTVTKVNGTDNELVGEGQGAVIGIEETVERRVVMEEFTGTWCGWCPRGMVGMRQLKADWGQRFIGLSIHNGDPMALTDYDTMLPSGYPSCNLDREVTCDPFFGSNYGPGVETSYGINDDVKRQMGELTEASVDLTTAWTGSDSTRITATATVRLAYDRDDTPPYSLAFVLLADSLTGSGGSWAQNNDFTLPMAQGYASDPYLGFLTQLDQHITGVKYNDVVIATYGIRRGVSGSVAGPFEKGVGKGFSHTFNTSGNRLVQDKRNLKIVALLLDTDTGRIVNAAESRAETGASDGILDIPAELEWGQAAACYTLDGRRIDKPRHGVNIVRQASGKAVKVLIK